MRLIAWFRFEIIHAEYQNVLYVMRVCETELFQDYEEENNLLQTQLATTEATLQSTMDVLQKVKEKAMESQAEADELKIILEKTRFLAAF